MTNKSKKIMSEISAGELLDKISILEIKIEKVIDKNSQKEIKKEYKILKEIQKNILKFFRIILMYLIWDTVFYQKQNPKQSNT